jgi:hypothetical protein
MNWGASGWLLIAAIVTAAAVGLHPSVRMSQRFLQRHVPPEDTPTSGEADGAAVPPPSLLEDPPLSPAGDGFGPPTAQR